MITITHLSTSYGSTRALDDVSFDVPDAHVTAIIGPNGAAKSTLMRTLMGLEPPGSGEALFGGKSVLLSSHLILEVTAIANRISVMAERKVLEQGSIDDVLGTGSRVVTASTDNNVAFTDALTAAGIEHSVRVAALRCAGATVTATTGLRRIIPCH